MKNLLLLLAVATIGLTSCNKKGCTDPQAVNYDSDAMKDDETCNYKPVISITGSQSMMVTLGTIYVDPGATASNSDGTAVTVTPDLSEVNTSVVGAFTVTYTASNIHGTSTKTRTVEVIVGQDNWLGSPTVSNDCNIALFPLTGSPTITAGSSTSDIVIDNMFTIFGGTVNAVISGQTITIPQQTVGITLGDIILSGDGAMNINGTQFTVNYTYENTTPLVGGSGSCTATYSL